METYNENLFRDIDQFLFYLIGIGYYAYLVSTQHITLPANVTQVFQ